MKYLSTLDYQQFVQEAKRAHSLSRATDSLNDLQFPDHGISDVEYMMRPSAYLKLVHQQISLVVSNRGNKA